MHRVRRGSSRKSLSIQRLRSASDERLQQSALGQIERNIRQWTSTESLRLHPMFRIHKREANEDDVTLLAFPITTKSGEQITPIPIKRGTHQYFNGRLQSRTTLAYLVLLS
ncbi:hypothetical protein BC827DRAFT_885833 [Russula dissimulans]|nr:hypothetical protein BC827DRAFT_885833 [Russula dissimulans]